MRQRPGKPATIETPDGDLLTLWHVDEDGQCSHWVIAETATEAMREACSYIDECDPGEVEEITVRKVTEREAFWLKLFDDEGPRRTFLEALPGSQSGYFACSEF